MARSGIFGRSGVGKSWFFGMYLERVVPNFDYAVHFDKEDEERGLSRQGDSLLKTFYVDKEFFHDTRQVQGREVPLVIAVILKNKKVRVVPDGLTPDENRELFAQICNLAMKLGKTDSNFHVSADEAHEVAPAIGDDLDERVVRMLTGGRKKGVEWALTTQRPAKLHEDAYTQMNYGVYFHLSKDNDIAKVNGSCGFDAYNKLDRLGPREAYIEDLDEGSLKLVSTEDMDRERPHLAADDGTADEAFRAMDGEMEKDPSEGVEG